MPAVQQAQIAVRYDWRRGPSYYTTIGRPEVVIDTIPTILRDMVTENRRFIVANVRPGKMPKVVKQSGCGFWTRITVLGVADSVSADDVAYAFVDGVRTANRGMLPDWYGHDPAWLLVVMPDGKELQVEIDLWTPPPHNARLRELENWNGWPR